MEKQEFRRAYGLVRQFARDTKRDPVGFDMEGRMGPSAGFSYEAGVFVKTALSGGRFYLDATAAQRAASQAAIDSYAAREIAARPAPARLSTYDYT